MAKQGLLEKSILFDFAGRMARYRIPPADKKKCMVSFYSYARQIASIREKITLTYKKEEFDHEIGSWIPPVLPAQTPYRGPSWGSTYAKPKDPSELDIEDEDLARDYKLMYNKYSEMETKLRELNVDETEEK